MTQIPAAYRQPCEFCNQPLDTRAEGVFRYTSGWVMQRSGGGGHGISLPKREDRWAHGDCVDREARGLTKQTTLGI